MTDATDALAEFSEISAVLAQAKAEIQQRFLGQDEVIEQVLISILSGGHALLVGVPGLGKTLLAQTLGQVLGLSQNRVQFTPDLMPSDILGSEILETNADGSRGFRFVKGPVFCEILMADEINRASARTQSALLQAMQERQVTIAGETFDLGMPYHVIATQNPIEQEGTYPLPEAQLDRFLMQVNIGYPDLTTERAIILATTGTQILSSQPVCNAAILHSAQQLVRDMPVGEQIVEAILALTRACRPGSQDTHDLIARHVAWGPGPRASQAFMFAIRARALLSGRMAPAIEDVTALAAPILRHRMALNYTARAENIVFEDILEAVFQEISALRNVA